jgi:hypothetical protein
MHDLDRQEIVGCCGPDLDRDAVGEQRVDAAGRCLRWNAVLPAGDSEERTRVGGSLGRRAAEPVADRHHALDVADLADDTRITTGRSDVPGRVSAAS